MTSPITLGAIQSTYAQLFDFRTSAMSHGKSRAASASRFRSSTPIADTPSS
jgi:hypothetical protein